MPVSPRTRRVLRHAAGALLALVALAGAAAIALTGWALWLGGAGIVVAALGGLALDRRLGAALALGGAVLAGGGRALNLDVERPETRVATLAPGQYNARSSDWLHLVGVRVIVRDGGHIIHADAMGETWAGIDQATLRRETHEMLFHQDLPPEAHPQSDPFTARLVREALGKALSGERPPVTPQIPEGVRLDASGADSYWGMFPSEYDHRCDLSRVRPGTYVAQSTNPVYQVVAQVTFERERLAGVKLLDGHHSEYGAPAFSRMPGEMVRKGRVDVDIVAGATRSSLLIRSAVHAACVQAGGAVPRPGKG